MITCTRRIQFCAGHRVLGHENKCANLHGHNYVAMLTAAADSDNLDSIGRVVDFSVLKEKIGGWIDDIWDHGLIVYERDEVLLAMMRAKGMHSKFHVVDFNPTAENMAWFLLHQVGPKQLAETGVRLVRVELWETENCRAEVTL